MKIKSFNEYRELVTKGELTFEKLFKDTEPEQVFEIATKIAKAYENIIMNDEELCISRNELMMINSIFKLIFIFGRMNPEFRNVETEAIFYTLMACATETLMACATE